MRTHYSSRMITPLPSTILLRKAKAATNELSETIGEVPISLPDITEGSANDVLVDELACQRYVIIAQEAIPVKSRE